MPRVQLISTPYSGRSVIASGQECVNLYAEINATLDPQSPSQTTYYPTPGQLLYSQDPNNVFPSRGCYRTSIGTAYFVVKQNVYFVNADKTLSVVGVIADRPSQVYFDDNGLVVVLVDGVNGYVIDINTNAFGTIVDPNFYGADYVTLLDTFFIFNRPKTNQFYITESNADFGDLTNTSVSNGTIVGGTGGTNGVYQGVS